MLIDDDEDSNFVNNWIIKQEFAEKVLVMESALKALEYLNNNACPEKLPDVIFLDLRMPLMDGFDFLNEFAKLSDVVLKKCKIIVLSSSFDKRDYDRAVNNKYVFQYLIKPINIDEVAQI